MGAEGSGIPQVDRRASEAAREDAARTERLRRDGARGVGENIEQAHALIATAFELRTVFSVGRP